MTHAWIKNKGEAFNPDPRYSLPGFDGKPSYRHDGL